LVELAVDPFVDSRGMLANWRAAVLEILEAADFPS
jgi:hypothetical protein